MARDRSRKEPANLRPDRDRPKSRAFRPFAEGCLLEPRTLLASDATSTLLSVSAATVAPGANLTLTASVTDLTNSAATPTGGAVTFKEGATVLGTGSLVNGMATFSTSVLGLGVHGLAAVYAGAGTYAASATGVTPSSALSTVAGVGTDGDTGDGGAATSAQLGPPVGIVVDASGNRYVSDPEHHLVRKITAAGVISTFAGTGIDGNSGDGNPATAAKLGAPGALAVDSQGDLLIADATKGVVREVTPDGKIHTIAGNGVVGHLGDNGQATLAELNDPEGLALDAAGNLYIADAGNNVVRQVTLAGLILPFAGNGLVGFTGNLGVATLAALNDPTGLAFDAQGDLFIADTGNNAVREVTTGLIIQTVAGTGSNGFAGDGGAATSATLKFPRGLAVDGQGDLFIADTGNNAVREVTGAGKIRTLAGSPTGVAGGSGDGGPGSAALLNAPRAIALDGSGNLLIADSGNDKVRQAGGPVSVLIGAPHFVVAGVPSAVPAGTAETFAVTAYNADGTINTGYAGTVRFTSTDGQAALPANATLTNGTGTFGVTLKTAGTESIAATDTANAALTGSEAGIAVSPAAASHLALAGAVAEVAGGVESITVTALDPYGNVATGYAGTVHLTSTDGQAVLPADATLSAGIGTFSVTLKTAGLEAIAAADTATPSIAGIESGIAVSPAAAARLAVAGALAEVAGGVETITVTALDAFGNVATGYAGTVHLASTDARAVLPPNSTLNAGMGTFHVTLETAGTQAITAADAVNPAIGGTEAGIAVTPAAAARLAVAGALTDVAGGSEVVTVTALDPFDNVATGYAGTVHVTSTDGQAVLPADATLTNGVGTFAVTLKTAGVRSITAADTAVPSIAGTLAGIAVTPAAAARLALAGAVNEVAGGVETIAVTALDPFGNVATGYAGTVRLVSTDGQAVLPVAATLTNGVGTFAVTLKTAGTQAITAADTAIPALAGVAGGILVTPAAASHLAVAGAVSEVAGGVEVVTVTALDAFGNVATGYAGTVHLTSTDAQATLPPNATLTNGVGSFAVTLKTAGVRSIAAADLANPSIGGAEAGIVVSPAAASHLAVAGAVAEVAGGVEPITVTALDPYGNVATGYAGIVHFTSSDARAVLPADAMLAGGTGTFGVALKTAGLESITATDLVVPAIAGTEPGIAVSPAAAARFVVTGAVNEVAGGIETLGVAALDAFGNVATGYSGIVRITSTDARAILPPAAGLVNGVGSFPVTLETAGTQAIAATDAADPTILGSASGIAVTPASAAHLLVTGAVNESAGGVETVTITAIDPFGNIATGYAGTVHVTSTDPRAILPADATLAGGSGSFALTLETAGLQAIIATDAANPGLTGTQSSILVAPAAATHLVVTGAVAEVAGGSEAVTVTAYDAAGNVATGYAGTVQITSSDPQAVLPPDAALSGGTGTFNVILKTAGSESITATDALNPAITGAAPGIAISPAAAVRFVVAGLAAAGAGGLDPITVTAVDPFGNIAGGYGGTVHFASSDAQAILPADSSLTNGVGAFNVTLKTAGVRSITATDTVNPAVLGVDAGIAVSPAAASRFVVDGGVAEAAGGVESITVTALDPFGNVATGYAGVVQFASSDPQAVLPAPATLSGGVGTFGVTLKTAGPQAIGVADAAFPAVAGAESGILVRAAAATHLVVAGAVAEAAGGVETVAVTAYDAFGNVASGFADPVRFASTDARAVLPPNSTLTAGAGIFNVTLETAGTQAITATDALNPAIGGTEAGIAVTPAAASRFAVSGASAVTAGGVETVTVMALDPFGNVATGYAGTVHIRTSDPRAILPPDAPLVGGTATFSVALETAGIQSISATDPATPALFGAQASIVVGPAAAASFTVTGGVNESAGGVEDVTVTAYDAFGNVATGYAGTVHITSSDGQAVLPPDATLTNGVGTFAVTLKTAGTRAIAATDAANPALTGTESGIAVTPAAATRFVVSGATNEVAGGVEAVTVAAYDAYGNPATGYAGTVRLTSSDAQAVLPPGATLSGGTGSFDVTLKTAGTESITATDAASPSIAGAQSGIVVSPAAAASFAVTGAATDVAGGIEAVTVTALDPFGNIASGYAGTVQVTSSDPQAVLPAPAMLTNGVGTFAVTLKTAGPESIAAVDPAAPGLSGTDSGIAVTPAAAARLVIAGASPPVVGQPETFTVTAVDPYGNIATGDNGTVTVTSSDPAATFPGSVGLAGGVGRFTVVFGTAGTQSITATDPANPGINGTDSGLTVEQPVATLSISGPTVGVVAGSTATYTVTALDANGQVVTGFLGTLDLSSSDPRAVLPTGLTFVNGMATIGVRFGTAGPESLAATVEGHAGLAATEAGIAVVAGSASRFVLAGLAGLTSGTPGNLTVTAEDAYGNVAAGYSGTVHFTSSDGRAILPPDATLAGGMGTFRVTLETAGAESVTASDTLNPSITGTDSPIAVSPAAATHLVVTGATAEAAGGVETVTVAAYDAYGNLATGYAGTVHLTSSDGRAILPADAMLANGHGIFRVTLETAGSESIAATDTANPALTGTEAGIMVSPASATRFVVAGAVDEVAGGIETVTVTAYDAYGNPATGYAGMVHFTSSDPQAALPADAHLSGGTGTFDVTLKTAGTDSIAATDASNPGLTGSQAGIVVSPAAATHLVVTGATAEAAGGVEAVTVAASDAYGNLATGYAGTVHLTSTDPQAVLPPDAALSGGTGTFHVTLETAGSDSIAATDSANPAVSGTEAGIMVSPAAAMRLVVSGAVNEVAGGVESVTVTAYDAYGNLATGYAGTVQLASSDPRATLPAAATLTNGTGTFALTLTTAGTQAITATDAANPALSGSEGGIAVSPAAAASFAVTGGTADVAGGSETLTVTALDPYGNVATGYAGTVQVSSSDPQAALPPPAMLTNGVGTFVVTLVTAGSDSITATDAANPAIGGTEGGIAVSPAAATQLVVAGDPAPVAGQPERFTVTAKDPYGNTATATNTAVTVSSSDPAAGLPGPVTLTAGVGSFPVDFHTPGIQSVSASGGSLSGTDSGLVVQQGVNHLTISGPTAGVVAGSTATYTVTAVDASGAVVMGFRGTLDLSSGDARAVLPSGVTFVAGVATVGVRFGTAGTQSLAAVDPGQAGLSATVPSIGVVAGAASRFVLGGLVGTAGGATESLRVTAEDAFGNVAAGYSGIVHFSSTDPAATLPADSTLAGGAGVFPITLETGGSQTVTATDTATGFSATTSPVAVSAMIRGTVYLDLNADGSPEAGEPGLAGRTVFLDLLGSGAYATGDPTAVTDASGDFAFPGVAPGSANVLELPGRDDNQQYVVDQASTNADGSLAIGVVAYSPIAPVPVVPSPFGGTPAADATSGYVQSLYRSVLGRSAGPEEIAGWVSLMKGGATAEQVAAAFVNSPEHRAEQVAAYYEDFLHRAVDPGAAYWIDMLEAGMSEQEVVTGILDSPEYQQEHQDPASYVTALYADVLGRQVGADEVAVFTSALASGTGRQAVVADFVESPEAFDQIIDGFYSAYLHRQREEPSSDYWIDQLAAGDSATDVAIGILTSPEFLEEPKRA